MSLLWWVTGFAALEIILHLSFMTWGEVFRQMYHDLQVAVSTSPVYNLAAYQTATGYVLWCWEGLEFRHRAGWVLQFLRTTDYLPTRAWAQGVWLWTQSSVNKVLHVCAYQKNARHILSSITDGWDTTWAAAQSHYGTLTTMLRYVNITGNAFLGEETLSNLKYMFIVLLIVGMITARVIVNYGLRRGKKYIDHRVEETTATILAQHLALNTGPSPDVPCRSAPRQAPASVKGKMPAYQPARRGRSSLQGAANPRDNSPRSRILSVGSLSSTSGNETETAPSPPPTPDYLDWDIHPENASQYMF